ncbi:hypothetical protein [Allosalinactinospora lopnorensis]|uniref:hypothetical protein n=1 Tax=Allosalinactinospora lopnorensis TaxID=1352348 RepID=UPI000696F3EE|nr:hypothetical protein [Allosalinactinospora lopnorensis]
MIILGDLVRLSDLEHERALLDEGIALAGEIGVNGLDAVLRSRRAFARANQGETEAARRDVAEITPVGLEREGVIMLRLAEAEIERVAGAAARARSVLLGVLKETENMGRVVRRQVEPVCYANLARTAMELGEPEESWRYAVTAWNGILPGTEATQAGLVLEVLAEKVLGESPERAATLLGYAEAVRGLPNEAEPNIVRLRARARARLGDAGFAQAYRKGADTGRADIVSDIGAWLERRARA